MPIRVHTVATEQGMAVIFEDHVEDLDNFMVIHPGTVRRPVPVVFMTNGPADVYGRRQIKTIDRQTFNFKKLLHYGVLPFEDVTMLGLIFQPLSNKVSAKIYGTFKGRRAILSALTATDGEAWKQPKVTHPASIGLDLFDRGVVASTYERNGTQETEEDRYDLIVELPYGKPLFRRPRPVTAPADSSAG